MVKKILALALVLLVVLGCCLLCGCGEKYVVSAAIAWSEYVPETNSDKSGPLNLVFNSEKDELYIHIYYSEGHYYKFSFLEFRIRKHSDYDRWIRATGSLITTEGTYNGQVMTSTPINHREYFFVENRGEYVFKWTINFENEPKYDVSSKTFTLHVTVD